MSLYYTALVETILGCLHAHEKKMDDWHALVENKNVMYCVPLVFSLVFCYILQNHIINKEKNEINTWTGLFKDFTSIQF